jgi:hypothetical protein
MATKMSLNVIFREAKPACMAGVLVSLPNLNEECGRQKL